MSSINKTSHQSSISIDNNIPIFNASTDEIVGLYIYCNIGISLCNPCKIWSFR